METLSLFIDNLTPFLQELSRYNATIELKDEVTLEISIEENAFANEGKVRAMLVQIAYKDARRRYKELQLFRSSCPCTTCRGKSPCSLDYDLKFDCRQCCRYSNIPFCKDVKRINIKTVPVDELAKLADSFSTLAVNESQLDILMNSINTMSL
jgi:hypothetical protein